MSQSMMTGMLQDDDEFTWVFTPVGIDRFNGFEFESIGFDKSISKSAQHSIIYMFLDSNGRVFSLTSNAAVYVFDRELGIFIPFYTSSQELLVNAAVVIENDWLALATNKGLYRLSLAAGQDAAIMPLLQNNNQLGEITGLTFDNNRTLWIATKDNQLFSMTSNTGSSLLGTALSYTFGHDEPVEFDFPMKLAVSVEGGIFVLFQSGNLYKVNADRLEAQLVISADELGLPINKTKDFVQSSARYLWVTTKGKGLYQIDLLNQSKRHYTSQNNNKGGLTSNNLYAIYLNKQSQLWISAPNAINYAQVENNRFYQIGGNRAYTARLNSYANYEIVDDNDGNLWIATHDSSISVLPLGKSNSENNAQQLHSKRVGEHPFVTALVRGDNNDIWAGFPDALKRYDATTTKPLDIAPRLIEAGKKGIRDIRITKNEKLITTIDNQVYFQDASGKILQFESPIEAPRHDLDSIVGPVDGFYWFASLSTGQLLQFNQSSHQITTHTIYDKSKSPINAIGALWLSPHNELWVGSQGQGVVIKDLSSWESRWFDSDNGLADDNIYAILGDSLDNVWITGNKGITRYSPNNGQVRNFSTNDEIQSNEFNTASAYRNKEGLIFLGGINGISVFDEQRFLLIKHVPKTYIQGATLLTNQGLKELKVIGKTKLETLDYHANSLTFKIGAVEMFNANAVSYSYRLLGNSDTWVDVGNRRTISFLKLAPGDYTLEVTSCNSDQTCNSQAKQLSFTILPPPWLTLWAYAIYLALVVGLLFYSYRRYRKKINDEQMATQQQRQIAEELSRLHIMKDEFLANTSHELRTPLNGIIGISHMLKSDFDDFNIEESRELLNAIHDCGEQLKDLVEDLLEFSQLNGKRLTLKQAYFDINQTIEQVLLLLQTQSAQKNLTLVPNLEAGKLLVFADENRIRQVLINLVGNAIKFSDEGSITVSSKLITAKEVSEESSYPSVQITVKDQGIGIPMAQQKKVFESFAQADGSNSRSQGGLGLGLSICKGILDLHDTKLDLISQQGRGSKFQFLLKTKSRPSK